MSFFRSSLMHMAGIEDDDGGYVEKMLARSSEKKKKDSGGDLKQKPKKVKEERTITWRQLRGICWDTPNAPVCDHCWKYVMSSPVGDRSKSIKCNSQNCLVWKRLGKLKGNK